MVRKRPLWAAAACGAVLGLGGIVAVDAATDQAGAQGGFTVSAEQLRINQRISQAAVRRSNEALGLLGPVRPTESTDKNPVNPFSSLARGSGWPTAALADGAVTSPKLSPELRAQVGAGGPKGDKGDKGDTGPVGPVGPSETYYRERETDLELGLVNDVLSIDVPAGSYVANATVNLSSSSLTTATCNVGIGPSLLETTDFGPSTQVRFTGRASLPSQFAFTTPSPTTARVACGSSVAGGEVVDAGLAVTRVGSLTQEPGV